MQLLLLALARALVWNPPVLLLDEATAASDHAGEAALREALRVGARDEAVRVIAHRLATACGTDWRLAMDASRVVDEGGRMNWFALAGASSSTSAAKRPAGADSTTEWSTGTPRNC